MVPIKEIMIIDMDTLYHKDNYQNLKVLMNELKVQEDFCNINVHLAGTLHPEDFTREDSIVYSSINRAKGNETFVVYIINSQESMNKLSPIKARNEIFTAITRSKGWVNIIGFGAKMTTLMDEFNEVKNKNYSLLFKSYPTEHEKKKIRTTNIDIKKEQVVQIDNMERLLGSLSSEQFNEIMARFKDVKKDE